MVLPKKWLTTHLSQVVLKSDQNPILRRNPVPEVALEVGHASILTRIKVAMRDT